MTYIVRAVCVPVLRSGEVCHVPGPSGARPLQGGLQVHPPARVLPRPAQPPGGRPQGGGHHLLRQDEDLSLEAGGGHHTGGAGTAQHL